jgi:ring-1,2-phenylacetyl-CoA epoxidase subunit PaaE
MSSEATKHFHPNQGPQDAAFRMLLRRPKVAWPTIFWFMGTFAVWLLSTVAGCRGWWPVWCSVIVNGLMVFSFFTVVHDSSHRAISTNSFFNDLMGALSAWFYGPLTIFTLKSFRYLHMQHHLYTNEAKKDPDYWCAGGNKLQLFLSWLTVDFHYIFYYVKHWNERPAREKYGLILNTVSNLAILSVLIYYGYGWQAFFFWVIPGRIGIFILAFALDYLPHTPHKVLQADHPFQATNIRAGQEWLLTPLLMYHNYHLVHHLYPLAPFYRYIKIWRQGEDFFLEKQPALVTPLGKAMSVEEYKKKFKR